MSGTFKTKTEKVLLSKGKTSIVKTPPLEMIPGFSAYAAELEPEGIKSVGDFMTTDPEELAEMLETDKNDIIRMMKKLESWVTIRGKR